jgi:AcrR family transcriptional regulator
MPQVQKPEVRDKILRAALEVFAEHGFVAGTMPEIAARAGMAPANLYRYFDRKDALFAAAVPRTLVIEHTRLLAHSVRSLSGLASGTPMPSTPANDELLAFWLANRHAVIVLLDRAEGTPHADYGARFVRRLVALSITQLRATNPGAPISPEAKRVLASIFDGTRRAIVDILEHAPTDASLRESIAAFRSYQIAGIAGFAAWIRGGA